MARLVGVYASSHAPLIARDWTRLPETPKTQLVAAMRTLGQRLKAARPDVLIVISPDHWTNFFIDNLPNICIGIGAEHGGPPEPFMKPFFPHPTVPGHPGLAEHILRSALKDDFEPSVSHRLTLDHGFCLPLWRMELEALPRIIPITVNDIEPPMMSIRRCLAWGRLIARAVKSYPEDLRVAVLATGGLSHSIGEPTMGELDEAWDRGCVAAFGTGDDAKLTDFLEETLARPGNNGGHEVRNWVVAHGAAGSQGFDLVAYLPVPEVYVGCAFASWKVAA
jgi:aromatic ring-opening dioxygenase catalytic subunit (LigB family)